MSGVVTEPRTYEFTGEDDGADGDEDVELTFTVTDSWENAYGDQKAAVETPAPWEIPDDADVDADPNEVVKELDWDDYHYTFDGDDREAWTLDVDGLKPLAELAQAAGYEWEGRARSEQDGDDDDQDEQQQALRELAETAEEGDRVKVTYFKKNGNGKNTYKGTVEVASAGTDTKAKTSRKARRRGRTTTTGVVFEDTDGKVKRIRLDDEGEPALFSSGYHPFMGVISEVTLIR